MSWSPSIREGSKTGELMLNRIMLEEARGLPVQLITDRDKRYFGGAMRHVMELTGCKQTQTLSGFLNVLPDCPVSLVSHVILVIFALVGTWEHMGTMVLGRLGNPMGTWEHESGGHPRALGKPNGNMGTGNMHF